MVVHFFLAYNIIEFFICFSPGLFILGSISPLICFYVRMGFVVALSLFHSSPHSWVLLPI